MGFFKPTDGKTKELNEQLDNIEKKIDDHIESCSSGSGSGEGLTSEQAQQLATAYEHSQQQHVSFDDLNNINATSLNGYSFSEVMTLEEYNNLTTKDSNIIYLVIDDETETLRANYTCHIACMHCCMCSRTYKEVQTFEVLEFGGVPYCMCHDCADFITRSNIPSLNLSGRIPAKILKENNYVCDSCNGKLKGRFFFFSNGSILCKSCASP